MFIKITWNFRPFHMACVATRNELVIFSEFVKLPRKNVAIVKDWPIKWGWNYVKDSDEKCTWMHSIMVLMLVDPKCKVQCSQTNRMPNTKFTTAMDKKKIFCRFIYSPLTIRFRHNDEVHLQTGNAKNQCIFNETFIIHFENSTAMAGRLRTGSGWICLAAESFWVIWK